MHNSETREIRLQRALEQIRDHGLDYGEDYMDGYTDLRQIARTALDDVPTEDISLPESVQSFPEGIVGWTISIFQDANGQSVVGTHDIWWVHNHGPAKAKKLAQEQVDYLKKFMADNHGADTSSYILVPIAVGSMAPIQTEDAR